MTGKDTTTVSSGDDQKNAVPPWLRPIMRIQLCGLCETHSSRECNFYCRVCMFALCKECKKQHDVFEHEIIKAFKVNGAASFSMADLEPLWDISDICPYKGSRLLVAVIYKRGDGIASSRRWRDPAKCESCQYRLKSLSAKYCSIECKVEAVMKMNESESMKNEAKRKVETISEGSASNVQSFTKRPRMQKNP
ncbi:ATP-dependent Clp protease proteolytic subunit [Psidium guajava]|nr:ATP-dependent Clp protease proteolytic subunit [Psidium guajava]